MADHDDKDAAPEPGPEPEPEDDDGAHSKSRRPSLKLARPRFVSNAQLMMLLMLTVALICVVALRGACARGVARMVGSFDEPDAGVPKLRKPR